MFRVELDEDEESNPFCYGRQLGRWLQARFAERGYTPEEVFAEDWGWCVMLSRMWSLRFGKTRQAIECLSRAAEQASAVLESVLRSENGIELVSEP
jgi:hypothetical protein